MPWTPMDIEELNSHGSQNCFCPYYQQKERVKDADSRSALEISNWDADVAISHLAGKSTSASPLLSYQHFIMVLAVLLYINMKYIISIF